MSFGFELLELEQEFGAYAVAPSIATDVRVNNWTWLLKDDLDALVPDGLAVKHDKCFQSHHKVLMRSCPLWQEGYS